MICDIYIKYSLDNSNHHVGSDSEISHVSCYLFVLFCQTKIIVLILTRLHCRHHHHRLAILELGGRDLEGELESFEIIKMLFVGGSIN